MNAAQAAKSAVEDRQRELRLQRGERGEAAPGPRFFVAVGEKYMPKLDVDSLPKDVDELEAAVRKFIFGDRVPGPPPAESAPLGNNPAQSVEVAPVGPAGTPAEAAPAAAGAASGAGAVPGAGAGVGVPSSARSSALGAAPADARPGPGPVGGATLGSGVATPISAAPAGVSAISPVGHDDQRRSSVASSFSDDEFHDAVESPQASPRR